jgi:protein PET100
MYIMFPIGIMYYFGTNLDARFATPDFWPKEDQSHKIPFDRDEIKEELERLKQRRLAIRAQRLARESAGQSTDVTSNQERQAQQSKPEPLEATKVEEPGKSQIARQKGWMSWFR